MTITVTTDSTLEIALNRHEQERLYRCLYRMMQPEEHDEYSKSTLHWLNSLKELPHSTLFESQIRHEGTEDPADEIARYRTTYDILLLIERHGGAYEFVAE